MEVSAAVIQQNGRIMICQRREGTAYAGLWEFPGGKREPGETAEACLVRECLEELGIRIHVKGLLKAFHHPGKSEPSIHFSFFYATILSGEPVCHVHKEILWAPKDEMHKYTFCPADRPIVAALMARAGPEKMATEESKACRSSTTRDTRASG